MKLLIAALLAATTFTASAQTGDYVINTKGDTIKCELSLSWGNVKYKIEGKKPIKIDPDSLKEYFWEGRNIRQRVVSVEDSARREFVPVIENGTISLYERMGNNYGGALGALASAFNWYVDKNGGKLLNIKGGMLVATKTSAEAKDGFGEMLKDKPEVYEKYAALKKLSFADIRNLVHLYNTGQPFKAPGKNPDAKKDDAY